MSRPGLIFAVYVALVVAYFWYRISAAATSDDFRRIGAMSQYALVVVIFGSSILVVSLFDYPNFISPTFAIFLLTLSSAVFFLRTFEISTIILAGLLFSLIDYLSFFPRSVPMVIAFWISLGAGTYAGRLIFKIFFGAQIGEIVVVRLTRESWR